MHHRSSTRSHGRWLRLRRGRRLAVGGLLRCWSGLLLLRRRLTVGGLRRLLRRRLTVGGLRLRCGHRLTVGGLRGRWSGLLLRRRLTVGGLLGRRCRLLRCRLGGSLGSTADPVHDTQGTGDGLRCLINRRDTAGLTLQQSQRVAHGLQRRRTILRQLRPLRRFDFEQRPHRLSDRLCHFHHLRRHTGCLQRGEGLLEHLTSITCGTKWIGHPSLPEEPRAYHGDGIRRPFGTRLCTSRAAEVWAAAPAA